MTPAMRRTQRLGALALGLGLGLAMVGRYAWTGHGGAAHADHAPHHGGVLGMVGDVHLEVVRRDGVIEVYLSDAYRRPLPARGGRLVFEDGPTVPLVRNGRYLTAADHPRFDTVTCLVERTDGTTVEMSAYLGFIEAS